VLNIVEAIAGISWSGEELEPWEIVSSTSMAILDVALIDKAAKMATGATKQGEKTALQQAEESLKALSNCSRRLAPGNSFSPTTKVTTALGFTAIAALTVGTPVLAFNEQTNDTGYYPITQTHKNQDDAVTYLNISGEAVETTPNHPFYVAKQVDNTKRPIIKGHEDLSQRWVGAGDLKVGDQIKQAGGKDGTVNFVQTLAKPATMYNLTVAQAHTYYVGSGQWLVHNCGPGSPEHRAAAWEKYKAGQNNSGWDYSRWNKQYDINMQQARIGNAASDAYHQTLGWGTREVTVVTPGGAVRRLDIADLDARMGVEVKTGYITRSGEIDSEVMRDAALVRSGWGITWVFEGTASKPLLTLLDAHNIPYKIK
jgi:hypothetical protein